MSKKDKLVNNVDYVYSIDDFLNGFYMIENRAICYDCVYEDYGLKESPCNSCYVRRPKNFVHKKRRRIRKISL